MNKSPVSVRIIYILTQIVFWILIASTALAFFLNILAETRGLGDLQLRIQLPITFDLVETGSVEIYGKTNDIRIEEASGKMHVVDTPTRFAKSVLKVAFAAVLLILFMTWKFKLFITNIKNGKIFAKDNINNLKHMAYGLLSLWLMIKVYFALLYHLMVKRVEFETISINYQLSDDSALLVGALLLWLLAHVFTKGIEMKEEQALTI